MQGKHTHFVGTFDLQQGKMKVLKIAAEFGGE